LLQFEREKADLEQANAVSRTPSPVKPPNLAKLFRHKIERLEETLNSEPDITCKAAPILRTLINKVVLSPGDKRGRMSIEVRGEPSALFLLASEEASAAENWMIKVVAEEGLEPPTRGP
jgi:hypothetical protein